MADGELRVSTKAKELMFHTYKLTSNCDRYPKKYRHSLVDRIQLISMDIHKSLLQANRTNNITHKRQRCEYITDAITYCDELLTYIELSMMLKLITDKSAKYWSGLVTDIKHMSLAWRKKEQK